LNLVSNDSLLIYQEMVDLPTSGSTAAQLLAFKISDSAQEHLEELLRKNREEELTAEERADLNTLTFVRVSI
jgi:hypothetical protein